MSVDYDKPRSAGQFEQADDAFPLKSTRGARPDTEIDDNEQAEGFDLPGADLSGEEFSVRVIPKQANEFTCSRCFLVHHHSQLAMSSGGELICRDCV